MSGTRFRFVGVRSSLTPRHSAIRGEALKLCAAADSPSAVWGRATDNFDNDCRRVRAHLAIGGSRWAGLDSATFPG